MSTSCPECGKDNPEDARFCMSCGHSLPEAAGPREARKTVTVVFTDVSGSTTLGERLDPESLAHVMGRFFESMRTTLERHGGKVEKFIGDAVMAVFGVPQVHEDDALRALRAACEMREAIASLNVELERDWGVAISTRTGVNTGEVIVRDSAASQAFVSGDVVNVAARLEQAAEQGEILIGEPTQRLVRDAVMSEPVPPIALKGKAQPVPAFRLVQLSTEAGTRRRVTSPMVGRRRESTLLQWAFERTVEEGRCQLITILGAAGVGKSRLVEDFLGRVGAAIVYRGRCLPYGEGITFWPFAEVVRQAVGATGDTSAEETQRLVAGALAGESDAASIADRVAQAVGASGGAANPEEIFWAARKLMEFLARRNPLVLVFEDIHWGEATFLDLVEHIADLSRDAPILLICIARPELFERRPAWGGGKLNASTVLVEPLTDAESGVLIQNLLGNADLPVSATAAISAAAGGNPLFLEELLSTLIDQGSLRRSGDRWTPVGDLSTVSVPPTIQALLAARLDLLDQEERLVLEAASVEGMVFHQAAVLNGCPAAIHLRIPDHLLSLLRKELIRSDQPEFAGEAAFRFRHVLIRDAAYQGMAKEIRAELHERYANWLERRAGEGSHEYQEILGYHLEQAYQHLAQLGPIDERSEDLAARAGERLAAAGHRAVARGDPGAAVSLLGRAVSLLPDTHPVYVQALVDLGAAFAGVRDFHRADQTLSEAIGKAQESADRLYEWRAHIERAHVGLLTEPEGRLEEGLRLAEQAIPVFEGLEDDEGLAAAWRMRTLAAGGLGRASEVEGGLERAIEHASRSGAAYSLGELYGFLLLTAIRGSAALDEVITRVRRIIERAGGDPRADVVTLMHRGIRLGMEGNFADAREVLSRAEALRRDLGFSLSADILVGRAKFFVEMLAGDRAAAEASMRQEYETLQRIGERTVLGTDAGYLAQAIYAQGRYEEAERFSRVCEDSSFSDDGPSQILWRSVRAKVLAREGTCEHAESLAMEAVELSRKTDYVWMQADAMSDTAEVLRLCGRDRQAVSLLEEALRLYEAKGVQPSVERVRELLGELQK